MKPSDLKLQVASPCSVAWDEMSGDNSVRHCGKCEKSVYNLSALNVREIEELVRKNGNKFCRKYYLRSDGTILTEDCPVGLRWIRRKIAKTAFAAISLIAGALAIRNSENRISRIAAGIEATKLGKMSLVRRLIDSYRLELHANVAATEALESRFPTVNLTPLVQAETEQHQVGSVHSAETSSAPHWPETPLQTLKIDYKQLQSAQSRPSYPRQWYTVSGWGS